MFKVTFKTAAKDFAQIFVFTFLTLTGLYTLFHLVENPSAIYTFSVVKMTLTTLFASVVLLVVIDGESHAAHVARQKKQARNRKNHFVNQI